MDLFLEWLNNNREHDALKDASYRKTYQKENHLPDTTNSLSVNTKLATYGDAVLKLALCELLWDNKEQGLSEEKKKYESDRVLVEIVGKHYDILKYLKFDEEDPKMPRDYDYPEEDNRKGKKYKYIATAIEACLGAIWMEMKDFEKICKIVKDWKDLIDANSQSPK